MSETLEISVFGTCVVRLSGEAPVEIRGAKHRGLVALLATAPMGRKTRATLQQTLWGDAGYDSGHQNLRRALSDLRKSLGNAFDQFFHLSNADVELDLDKVRFIGAPQDGPFLADLSVHTAAFQEWVQSVRTAPEDVAALHRLRTRSSTGRARPRIAALPLTAIGASPELRILGDWVAEETCRSLSRSNLLTVISHLSSRAMAQRLIDISAVRETLDADYLVTGSIRTSSESHIVDVDFVDAQTGNLLWNRHFSIAAAGFTDSFQEHLVNIVETIGRTIADMALNYVRNTPLPMVEDHKLIMAGVSMMHRSPIGDFLKSRDLLMEATARLPRTPDAHAWLAKWYVLSVFKGLTTDREGDTQKALDETARALDMDPHSSFSLTIDGFANSNLLKDMSVAERRYADALDLNPSESLAWLLRGALMAFQDDGQSAIRATETARRLSPIDPFGYYYDSLASTAYVAAGDFESALDRAERSLRVNDRHLSTMRTRITALHFLGRSHEAKKHAADLLRRFPAFSVEEYRRTHPSADHRAGQMVIEALTASGIS